MALCLLLVRAATVGASFSLALLECGGLTPL
jgi:hypothetical protein